MRESPATKTGASPWRTVAILAGVVIVQFLSVELGFALMFPDRGTGTIWPAAGVLTAILMLSPRNRWLGIMAAAFAGELLANMHAEYAMLAASQVTAVNVTQSAALAWIVLRVGKTNRCCESVGHFVGFFALTATTVAMLGLVAAAVIRLNFPVTSSYWTLWQNWWVSDVLGIMIGAPLVLTWGRVDSLKADWRRILEASSLALGIGISTSVIFGTESAGPGLHLLSLLYITFPLLTWTALRFGPVGTSTALFGASVISVWFTARELGPMAAIGDTVTLQVFYLQIYLAVAIGSSFILAAATDEQRRSELAVRQEAERFQTIIDNIPVMVATHDGRGRVHHFNHEFGRVMGWTLDELARVDLMEECYPDPDTRKNVVEHMGSPNSGWRLFKTRIKGGRILDTLWANVQLSDGSYLGIGQDVTEQQELEAQLRQSQKMEAIGRLSGRIAHDFNNLLTVILGYTKLSLDYPHSGEELRENLDQTRLATERAAQLTRQLLAFSRKQVRQPRVLDLNEIVGKMVSMIRRLIGPDVTLHMKTAPGLRPIMIDPNQIEQAILNLVLNARDAMPQGGHLSISTEDAETPALENPSAGTDTGPWTQLTLSDTGIGMDEETRSRAFEPFFTTKEEDKGTGLGLATVYAIVGQAGGHISVDSAPGAGSEFRIYLPDANAPIAEASEPESTRAPSGSETILVVEDEDMVRNLIANILERAGYNVLQAERPSEALRICESHGPAIDLMLTDVVMPEMNGRELAERVVRMRPIDIMYMSGFTDAAIGTEGILAPEVPFIEKPFSEEVLLKTIRDFFDAGDNSRTGAQPGVA